MFWKFKSKDKPGKEFLSPNDIRGLLLELQLPQTVIELFDGACTNEKAKKHLAGQYKAPYIFFDTPLNRLESYKLDRYRPLLASFQDKVFAYDIVAKSFVSYGVERFREQQLRHFTWEGLLVQEIITWWENDTMPDEDIICLGELLGLKRTKDLVEEIAAHDSSKASEEYHERIAWELALAEKTGGQANSL